MLVCWIASFLVLPALLLRCARNVKQEPSRSFGSLVVRLFGFRRPVLACAIAGVVLVGAGAVSYRYATNDPFEYDMTQLRSEAPDALRVRSWLALSDETFGRGLAGIAGQTYVAVDHVDEVQGVVTALNAIRTTEPIVGPIQSILDVLPPDQAAKLAVLAELRAHLAPWRLAGDAARRKNAGFADEDAWARDQPGNFDPVRPAERTTKFAGDAIQQLANVGESVVSFVGE